MEEVVEAKATWVDDAGVELLVVLLNLKDEVAGRREVMGVVEEAVDLEVSFSVMCDL